MLRNPIFDAFYGVGGGGGSVHPLDPPMSCSFSLVGMKKSFSVHSSLRSPMQTCHIILFSLYKCHIVLSNGRRQPELLFKIPSGCIKLRCTVCVLNVMQEEKMSMCIHYCRLYGSIIRGIQEFLSGGGGGGGGGGGKGVQAQLT